MRKFGWVAGFLVLVALAGRPAMAQLGVYGEFTGANTGVANAPNLYGGTFGFYSARHLGVVALGTDFRGSILSRGAQNGTGSDQVLDLGLGGVRLAVTPHVFPLMPYVEALAGVGYTRNGQGTSREDSTNFAAQFIAGVDYTIVPRVDWRVAEFSYGHLAASAGAINPETVSTGIVVRLH